MWGILIIYLVISGIATVLALAAVMRSSQISREMEGRLSPTNNAVKAPRTRSRSYPQPVKGVAAD
jgi:hypothetical protein